MTKLSGAKPHSWVKNLNFTSTSVILLLGVPTLLDFFFFNSIVARISRVVCLSLVCMGLWARRKKLFSDHSIGFSIFFLALALYLLGTISALLNSGVATPNVASLLIFVLIATGNERNLTDLRNGISSTVHILCAFSVFVILLRLNPRSLYLSDFGYPVFFDGAGIPGRNYGVFSHPNGLGQIAAIALIFIFFERKNWFMFLPALFCLSKSGSRTALLALAVSLIFLLLHYLKPRKIFSKGKLYFSEVFIAAGILVGVTGSIYFILLLNRFQPNQLTGRVQIWQTAKELFRSNLWFGLGWDWEGRAIDANLLSVWAVSAHNVILEVLFSTGFVGLILFFYIFVTSLIGVGRLPALDTGLLIALSIFGVSESILDMQYPGVTTFIFFYIALASRKEILRSA